MFVRESIRDLLYDDLRIYYIPETRGNKREIYRSIREIYRSYKGSGDQESLTQVKVFLKGNRNTDGH